MKKEKRSRKPPAPQAAPEEKSDHILVVDDVEIRGVAADRFLAHIGVNRGPCGYIYKV